MKSKKPSKNTPQKSSYPNLLQDLQKLLRTGQVQALSQLQKIRTDTYWQMGKRLCEVPEVKKQKKIPADWVETLSQDLEMGRSTLYRILQFYLAYPKGLSKKLQEKPLSWRSHVALLPLQDPVEREFYLKQASEKAWSEKQIRSALKQKLYAVSQLPSGKVGGRARLSKKLERPSTGLYLYQAVVERVIDGDTLLVRIDLGFDVWKSQRLRLRAVDCPELKTPEGQAAKSFVQEHLQANDFVILKTYKMDLHGRFVCDVFFSLGEKDKQKVFAEGTFLNQCLVENGHAVVV